MSISSQRFEAISDREWNERVAGEARHQALIEASFDRAEACERARDFEHALEWLDKAATLSGGMPPAYGARRARWARAAALTSRRGGSAPGTQPAPGRP